MANVSPAQIQKFLSGMEYPARKRDLIEHAQDRGAPQEVISTLKHLPDKGEFATPAEVSKALGEVA